MITRPIPPAPFRRPITGRIMGLWLFLRMVAGSAATDLELSAADMLRGTPTTFLWTTAMVAIAVRYDMGRRGESIFLANLGYSLPAFVAYATGLSILMEIGMRLALG